MTGSAGRGDRQATATTKRLLLLATTRTYRAAAFLEAARRLEVPVVVGSERSQILAPANPGGHLTLPFSQPREATRSIVEFARTYPLGAVVAADDDGVVLGAHAAAALGLAHNSVEAVSAARDKHRMRQVLARTGLPSPPFACFATTRDPSELAPGLSYPVVLKPLSRSGSQGVIRADDGPQFVAAFERIRRLLGDDASPEARILVEGFVPGAEVALEGLLCRGELRVLALFDKPDVGDGPFFEETIYVAPSRLPASVQDAVARTTGEVARVLGLCEGPVHAELRVNGEGAWLLEIAPRSIGGLCSRALRFSGGAPLEELIVRHALGLETQSLKRERLAAGVMMIPIPRAGVLQAVQGQEEARGVDGIDELRLAIPVGQTVVPLPEGDRSLGFLFARRDTPAQVEEALRQAHRCLEILIVPGPDPGPQPA